MSVLRPARAGIPALLTLVSALAPGAPAGAQPPAAPVFEERVEVTEVLLDVLVTDRDGNVILGLKPGDFKISEDGRPVEVTGARFYSNRRFLESASASKVGVDPSEVPQDRYFIVFLDDQRQASFDVPELMPRQLAAGRDAARWARTGLEPGDWLAVASFDTKLRLHQDFTRDREAAAAAIERAARGAEPPAAWPSRTSGETAPSLAAHLPPTARELRDQTPKIYDALAVLADASAAIEGRKNLMLFTIGFGRTNDFGLFVPDERFYRPMMERLNAANVAVYPIDLVPVGTRHPFSDSGNLLASDTGGKFLYDVLDFSVPLGEVARQNNGYYLVSFKSPHPAKATGFQDVEVRLASPEFRAVTRKGYRFGSG
ncbi:MAG: VWA domain-containing protein [Thermoanaerobaculia bacterium]